MNIQKENTVQSKIAYTFFLALIGYVSTMSPAKSWVGIDDVPPSLPGGAEYFSNSGSFNISQDVTSNNFENSLAGGYADDGSEVQGCSIANTATINGNGMLNLYGGFADTPSNVASNNNISSTGILNGISSIYGGYVNAISNATASVNTVKLKGTVGATMVFGGEANTATGIATASNNEVSISSGTYGGDIYGGKANDTSDNADAIAENNKMYLSGGNYSGIIAGGDVFSHNGGTKRHYQAANNEVHISGAGTYSNQIYGGHGQANNGLFSINHNKVYLEGTSTFGNSVNIYGGFISSASGSGMANNNEVYIKSGTYKGTIYGGYVSTPNGSATANHNKIYVYGNADLSSATLAGYSTGAAHSGNTLYFGYNGSAWTPDNYTIASVTNFDHIEFNAAKWGETITITNLQVTEDVSVDASNVAFTAEVPPKVGDSYDMLKVTNIQNNGLALKDGSTSVTSTYTIGTTVQGTGTVSISKTNGNSKYNKVTYTIATSQSSIPEEEQQPADSKASETAISSLPTYSAQPQTHGVAMAASATTSALTQGSDTSSMALYNLSTSRLKGVQTFSAVGGAASRVETGSHITVKTLNFSVGVGNNTETDYGLLTYGIAFEAGFGSFINSYNAGTADPYISKKGQVNYHGGTLVGNFTFNNLYHINAVFRIGNARTELNNGLYDASKRQTYGIKQSSMYTGLELGGGKIFKFDEDNSIDLYTKYYYLHQGSDDFYAGGNYHVHAVTSQRIKLAGRYQHDFSARTTIYAGLGGEYEFDGKAKVSLDYGVQAKSTDIDGFRGFAEIGMIIRPKEQSGFCLDFDIKGRHSSRYREIMAKMEIKYLF